MFLQRFTVSVTAVPTGELIEHGKQLGMWTSTAGGNARLFKLADEYLIKRQGHGWWVLTDIGMDLMLAAGVSVAAPLINELSVLEEQPDPDQPNVWYRPSGADIEIMQIVADSPGPINDHVVFRLGVASGKTWANKWSVGRRLIKSLVATGLLTRPSIGVLSITQYAQRYLPPTELSRNLSPVNRTPRVDDQSPS